MAATNGSSSLKLDPTAASALIASAAAAGGRATAAAGAADSIDLEGASPVDGALARHRAASSVMRSGWVSEVAACAARRHGGESQGVEAMSATEAENAGRLAEIGPQGGATTIFTA